jgi:hypothetical protein
VTGLDLLGADPTPAAVGPRKPATSREAYEALKRLPASELKVRADRVVAELKAWQTSVLADDNARAYAAALEQAEWQKANGDNATSDDERRLCYARCIHMAEEALFQFTSMGPGDSYWDTFKETGAKMRDSAKDVLRGAAKAPGAAFEWLTGVPSWVFWMGGAVALVGVGVGAWKLLVAAAPGFGAAVGGGFVPSGRRR